MLSRFISRPSNLRFLTLISSNPSLYSPSPFPPQSSQPFLCKPNFRFILETSRYFSSNQKDTEDDTGADTSISNSWKISPENNDGDSIFGDDGGNLAGIADCNVDFDSRSGKDSVVGSDVNDESCLKDSSVTGDIFSEIDKEFGSKKGSAEDEWETAEGYKPRSFVDEGIVGRPSVEDECLEKEKSGVDEQLKREEADLSVQLKGPNRPFGDLIATSGSTEAMLDSLEKNERKSARAEIEHKQQEELAKSRVRQVDEKGRAYGKGRRKRSVAHVWIQPGDGKFTVNDKQLDVYFPILDHRADLHRPFAETKTLGLWDVNCIVKGGGVPGQVRAIRRGIKRALRNWNPGLRPQLRSVGFLTRASCVVERNKPGNANARKSFQWVK